MKRTIQLRRGNRVSLFRRNLLPTPFQYYKGQGLKFIGGGEWKSACCPFHDDKRPSLRVRLDTGGFRCMACGAYGGDVLAFHMQRHRLSFVEAAKQLGAWEAER
ncbi:CHC2 zinc finger domain-containing protein [Nitrosospira multiformis]|uniref:CHC2 zinc finger domain-containing protein n=1 Tax=Nitrosospira multiformis TaxID=1231 RepID=UPI000895CEBE|nr:CHC2 zinc finger [Nitrosospira multiformis]